MKIHNLKKENTSGDQNAGRGDRMAGDLVKSWRPGDSFAGPVCHSANLEARRSFLRGTWRLCTPSLVPQTLSAILIGICN